MKPEGEIIPLFSTLVIRTNIGRSFTKEETDCIANISMMKDEGEPKHQSRAMYILDNVTNKGLKDIKKFYEQQLKIYLEEIEGVNIDLAKLRITQSWLNKTKPGEFHPTHYHHNSYLSGVFYFNCLPNDSINFDNRMNERQTLIEFSKNKLTAWNGTGAVIRVKEGDLVIFPSSLPHYVDVNETKDMERISLSFNTFPIGTLGEYNGTQLKL
jgi:uncharacterized protein (TIGR02466 family)